MHWSAIDTRLSYDVTGPAHFCFHLEVAHAAGQRVAGESLNIEGAGEWRHFTDSVSGNRFLRFDAEPGEVRVHYRAEVERVPMPQPRRLAEMPISALPDEVMPYLLPTRYCESDVMARAAQQLFCSHKPGLARVQAITDWIHDSIVYEPGSTDSTTTAQQVFVQRAGVCRDFAHLGVTFCRALNIPARLVVGYVWFEEPPQDFHALFEAWLGGRWVRFDPTRMAPVDRLVQVGTGRDAKDVAFCTLFGPVTMREKSIAVREYEAPRPRSRLGGAGEPRPPTRRVALMA